jgi:Uma2 family endonuclease
MSSTALMTFAEFEQLPDAPGKRELIDGELVTMPPPQLRHSTGIDRILAEAVPKRVRCNVLKARCPHICPQQDLQSAGC